MATLDLLEYENQRISINELIRRQLIEHLPDPDTDEGLAQIYDYAEEWRSNRGRGEKPSHTSNLRIPAEIYDRMRAAQLKLRRQQKPVQISAIISGLLTRTLS